VGLGLSTEQRRFFAFLLAAGASVPVNLAARVLASQVVPFAAAIVIAHLAGMLTAYALTRRFVFQRSHRKVHDELTRFATVNVLSLAITWSVAMAMVRFVLPAIQWTWWVEFTGHVTGLVAASVSSFFAHRGYSFRRA
jgi:putative flippase GtrA